MVLVALTLFPYKHTAANRKQDQFVEMKDYNFSEQITR